MRRYRRYAEEPEHSNADRWLVSYADYMTLMFAFFVVLYALAIFDEEEFQVFSDSLEQVFDKSSNKQEQKGTGITGEGILLKNSVQTEFELYGNSIIDEEKGPELVDGFGELTNLKQKKLGSPLDSLEQDLKTALFEELESGQAKLELNKDWLEIEMNSGLLFGSGSAVPTAQAKHVVSRVFTIIGNIENYIRVRGYTDNQPINNEVFSSNWQLSVARATEMLIALENEGINPARMAIEGYGEYAPFADNNSVAGRAENRKVVIALSKYGLITPSVDIDSQPTKKDDPELLSTLEQLEEKVAKQDDDSIKIIKLPNGGIRVTTRKEENQ